jgi:hypothetical protein
MTKEILPSITTLKYGESNWRDLIDEVDNLEITRIALFLTGLDREDRSECYERLFNLVIKRGLTIPFVHARHDMPADEYEMLMENFGTESFNLHPESQIKIEFPLHDELRAHIYIENCRDLVSDDLKGFAGVCLDLSHLEDSRMFWSEDDFLDIIKILNHNPIGCNHISAISETPKLDTYFNSNYCSRHTLNSLDELNYLKDYPKDYFGKYIANELTNKISRQLEVIEYIKDLINFDEIAR